MAKAAGWKHSLEAREKIRAASRRQSPQTRERIGATQRGRVRQAEVCQKISDALRGRSLSAEHRARLWTPERHASWTSERRAAASARMKARAYRPSNAVRQRVSASHKRRCEDATYKDALVHRVMTAQGGKRFKYLDSRGRLLAFRSSYELKYAQHLDRIGVQWDYEADRLLLSDGRVYVPDFRVDGRYVEIKGWLGRRGSDKAEQARRDGHDVELIVGEQMLVEACREVING